MEDVSTDATSGPSTIPMNNNKIEKHADRPSPGFQIPHKETTIDHDTQAATIHIAQWRNDSLSLKLFINSL
jgi:hypothetical protein